ncbi:TetR/AcrR family transcriptional regulator [Nocardioides sp. NPDC057767]|nr:MULTISPECIES: helix-turn-helix domain-containing protein [Nocardioides]MBC7277357.1 TetR/AcrR family transcriptional regulator [Nocardioides sp.]
MKVATRRPRKQAERSATTRRALLDATIACLADLGYAGTTSVAVAERAGLSRGAQLHHFGTRDQLVVAAVEHLAQERMRRVRTEMSRIAPQGAQLQKLTTVTQEREAALGLLAEALSGPLYAASLELWVAARSDPGLRKELVPAEERVNAELAEICRTYISDDPIEVRLTLDLVLGRGVARLLTPHPDRQAELLTAWARLLNGSTRG